MIGTVMVEKRSRTHWVECYDDVGNIVGFITGSTIKSKHHSTVKNTPNEKLFRAIFGTNKRALTERQQAEAELSIKLASDAERIANAVSAQTQREAEQKMRDSERNSRVSLVNAALEELRVTGLDVADQLGLVVHKYSGQVRAENSHRQYASHAALDCYIQCKSEGVTDLDRAADILAEILGLLEE